MINRAEKLWLNLEIKNHYSRLCDTELELYALHLEITKNLNSFEFCSFVQFQTDVCENVANIFQQKQQKQNEKLARLLNDCLQNHKVKPKFIDDFVLNLSSEQFSEDEIALLNKGLNYTPKPNGPHLMESIVDIETFLKFKPDHIKEEIRTVAKTAILDAKNRTWTTSNSDNDIIKRI